MSNALYYMVLLIFAVKLKIPIINVPCQIISKSKNNKEERLKELQSYIKNEKKKAIYLRLSENDIYELKKKALQNSIPYQNLLQMLIHQFVTDKIKLIV